MTRRGSNSSIGSTTSNKSREASNDFKEAKSSTHLQEEKDEVIKENGNIAIASMQPPVSSLFSPLRGGARSVLFTSFSTRKIKKTTKKAVFAFVADTSQTVTKPHQKTFNWL